MDVVRGVADTVVGQTKAVNLARETTELTGDIIGDNLPILYIHTWLGEFLTSTEIYWG